jgi:hypothetical protein
MRMTVFRLLRAIAAEKSILMSSGAALAMAAA